MKHALDPSVMSPVLGDYETTQAPRWYSCYCCGANGARLWREYNSFLSSQTLLCATCSETEQDKERGFAMSEGDQIGWRIPAIPCVDDDTYWGYTSVPTPGVAWWYGLAPRAGDPTDPESVLRRKASWLIAKLVRLEESYLALLRRR